MGDRQEPSGQMAGDGGSLSLYSASYGDLETKNIAPAPTPSP